MAEQRTFTHSVCVKTNAKTDVKFELFPAEQWGGRPGTFRVRRNRCWLEGAGGQHLFLEPDRIGVLVADAVAGQEADTREPALPKGSLVRVRRDADDACSYQRVYTKTDPWRGWDGRWYVLVHLCMRGDAMVPVDRCEWILAPARRAETSEEE